MEGTFWIVQLAVAPLAVYALYRYARLTWLRRRADRCAHERQLWASSPAGLSYQHALNDVLDHALEETNPCHDRVREWIVQRLDEITGDSDA